MSGYGITRQVPSGCRHWVVVVVAGTPLIIACDWVVWQVGGGA
jgi:hypothetical protein